MIDTHCHLDCEPLRQRLDELLPAARLSGVTGWVVPGVHPTDWERIAMVTSEHDGVMAAYGIHPMHAPMASDEQLARLTAFSADAVAIGEVGLDSACTVSRELQELAFRAQIRIAVERGLPLLVHCRGFFQRTLQLLREEGAERVGGIMHAFSGSPEMALEFIRTGFAISLAGNITWPGAIRPKRLAREVPLEWLTLETDAPDMTPLRFKGQPNQPAWLAEVLVAAAGIRGMLVTDLALATAGNTRRVLRLPHCS